MIRYLKVERKTVIKWWTLGDTAVPAKLGPGTGESALTTRLSIIKKWRVRS